MKSESSVVFAWMLLVAAAELAPSFNPKPDSYFLTGDDNKICIAVKLDILIEFVDSGHETKSNHKWTSNANYAGDCGEGNLKPHLTIIYEVANLTFAVEKNGNDSWQVTSLKLQFYPDKIFSHYEEPNVQTLAPRDVSVFAAPIGQSLSCHDQFTVMFYKKDNTLGAFSIVNMLRMQAFDVPPEFGPERLCSGITNEASPDKHEALPRKHIKEGSSNKPEDKSVQAVPMAIFLSMVILGLFVVSGVAIHRMMRQEQQDDSSLSKKILS